jgi:hypothetical protein
MKHIFTISLCFLALSLSAQNVTHTIAEVQGELFSSPLIEQVVTVQGVVTAENEYSYFIQDGTGPWNGIYIYDNTNFPAVGDEVILQGEVVEYFDLTEIVNITYFETVSTGNELPAAVELETGFIGTFGEPYEGCRVRITNAVCTNPDLGFGDAYFDDGTGYCMVDDWFYLTDPVWVLGEYYSVTGVLHYTYEEYKIEPLSSDDIIVGVFYNEGCTDANACNYVPVATIDDGTCEYPEQWYDCDGECISDVDNDGICAEDEIIGCTDLEAFNYNPEATDSDNTLCIYFVPDCNNFGDPGWLDTESGTYPEQSFGVFGEMYNEDIALHLSTTIVEAGSGVSYTLESFDFTSMSGLPEGLIATMTAEQMTPNSEVCVNVSGIPVETGVFDILLTGEAFINVFGNSIYAGVITFIHILEIGDNPNPISGCTYPGSDNYLLYAMVDDGTCIISGCTDPEASNFHPIFNLEDDSCQYIEDVSDCIEDLNQDGTIGTPDLLQLLSAYGQNCE